MIEKGRQDGCIPKVIHYVWFGGSPLGEKEQRCISTWKRICPDYSIVRWDETNFDISKNLYCKEAYDAKKWAFVSDYARLWVLVNYGGIYMDTDVEVIKPLDAFLKHDAFSGFESDTEIPTGIMGCKKGFPLFNELLHEYDGRHFKLDDGTLDITTNVSSITNACQSRGFIPNNRYQVIDGFALYPKDWFCPKDPATLEVGITDNTHTIHHFTGSWLKESERQIRALKERIISKHPGVDSRVAGAVAKLGYGFKNGDFHPLIQSIEKVLRDGDK